jgi:hypothetical protein
MGIGQVCKLPAAVCKAGSLDDECHQAEAGPRIFLKEKYRGKAHLQN